MNMNFNLKRNWKLSYTNPSQQNNRMPHSQPQNVQTSISNMMYGKSKTVTLFSQPYYDEYAQCYKNIVTINLEPEGPLAELVTRVKLRRTNQYPQESQCNKIKQCILGLVSIGSMGYGCNTCSSGSNKCQNLMTVDEVPNLFSFLLSNGYQVDTSITRMLNESDIRFDTNMGSKVICLLTYTL